MNKRNKIIARVMAVVLCVAAIGLGVGFGVKGCSNKNGETNNPSPSVTVPVKPVADSTAHYIDGGLHKVDVRESSRPFIVDGESDYKIIVGADNDDSREALLFLRTYIEKCTGASLPYEFYGEQTSFDASSEYIVLDCPELFEAAGLIMPDDPIGQTGYYIKSAGNSVFIATNSVYGYRYAVVAFLRHVLGFEMYSSDTVTYSKTGETLPDLDIIEKSDFEFRVYTNPMERDGIYGMGFLEMHEVFVPIDGYAQHNTFKALPPEVYQSTHPYWYSTDGTQLCYTAHGDEKEFEAMVDETFKRIVIYMEQFPDAGNVAFTQEDISTQCNCAACNEIMRDYQTISAAMVKFCNAVSRKIQDYLQEQAIANGTAKRDFNLLFFAYQRSSKPPAKLDGNGKWQPIDETVVCDDHVGVYIAPLLAFYNKSFYDDANNETANNIDGWAACSNKLYMWLYETNYSYYMYPLNSYDTMIETYRYCFDRGAIYMFTESQWDQGNNSLTHFSRLKDYINSKAQFDVNVDFSTLANDFFDNYFGEASVPMRTFFDELQGQLRYLEETYPADVNGVIYNEIQQTHFWKKRMLDHWLELCDEAYTLIEPLKTSDPERYNTLRRHIMLETMFPRYALIQLHAGSFGADELKAMQKSFRTDANELGMSRYRENYSLDEMFAEWGV